MALHRTRIVPFVIAFTALLPACGGGGGNSSAPPPTPTVTESVIIGTPEVGSGFSLSGSAADHRVPVQMLLFDRSPSASGQTTAVATAAGVVVKAFVTDNGGLGGTLLLSSFGGGPGDLRTIADDTTCLKGKRQCADPVAVEERSALPLAHIAAVFGQPVQVTGSDPFGSTYELLHTAATVAKGHAVTLDIYSDFFSISSVLDLRTTGFSTDEERAAVAAVLAGAGLDFGSLQLSDAFTVHVHLLPTETLAADAAGVEAMIALVQLVLDATGATVTVTMF